MKANELRIGNLIMYTNEKDLNRALRGTVLCVDIDTLMYVENNSRADFYEPIPLTPEILEKCGFDYDASYEVPKVQKGNFILWDGFDGSFSANFGGLTRLDVYVKYLHQLQNLYFALTCQELEVKL